MRRGARRLPQLSQRANGAVGSMTPTGAIVGTVTANMVGLPQDSNGPTSYWSSYSEIWELLRRIWRLEQGGPNNGGPGGGGAPGYNYVITCTFNGVFGDAQVFVRHPVRVPIRFAADFYNSAGDLAKGSESTGTCVISVKKSTDGGTVFSSVGTITYSAGNSVPAFAGAAAGVIDFAVGEILLVIGQATADATAGDLGLTLMAKMI